jgi:hypothetical protein
MSSHEMFDKRFFIIPIALAIAMSVGTESAFPAQEIRVGFIPGRGADASVEEQAFARAGIEFTKIDTVDYRLNRLMEFDVIGVGVVAYDSNPDLKANFNLLKEYVTNGGYLLTLDFQQDSTWNPDFLPNPITLLDDDLEENVGVVLADHGIFKAPNTITEGHFGPGIWGAGDFSADGAHEAKPPWQPLVTDRQNQWPLVVGAPAGKGYVVFSSLQTLQSLGRAGAQKVAEVLQNFLFWRGPLGGRVKAYGPTPADGALSLQTWVNVAWLAGDFAVSHNLYIGDNFDDVNNGAASTFRGNQVLTSLYVGLGLPGDPYPGGLVPGTTYYWRVDEVNDANAASPWKGDIWSFSIQPYTAYNPDPADGAEAIALNAKLTWTAGYGAKLHTVYFGENFDTVSSAVSGGALAGTTTYSPTGMKAGKVYYWRVDETDPPNVHKGQVWTFTTVGAVGNPHPSNGNASAEMNAILTWTPGSAAASHQVYFGTDKVAVRNAGTASPEYKGTRTLGAESYDPGLLARDSTYYWRVDEVNNVNPNSPWKGPVWSFTTGPYLLVDNFESYNDIDLPAAGSNRIFDKWIDGFLTPATNGAVVGNNLPPYAERTVVHDGKQSMPYSYDNNLKFSEATMTLTGAARDWTREGVASLSLWFRGATTNAADRMYVALNGTAVVYHDNPSATQRGGWAQWIIPLQTFADLGVRLTDVSSIAIGFGTRGNTTTAGGTGKMYIDDIRLYRPTTP